MGHHWICLYGFVETEHLHDQIWQQQTVGEGQKEAPGAGESLHGVLVCSEFDTLVCVCAASFILGGFSKSSIENLWQQWEGELIAACRSLATAYRKAKG